MKDDPSSIGMRADSLVAHVKAADDRLLMSAGLEDRIDMSAYRDPATTPSRPIRVIMTLDVKTRIDGKLVRYADGTPHPVLERTMQVIAFVVTSADALKLISAREWCDDTVTITDGNLETKLKLGCTYVSRPTVMLESVKDSDDVLVTLMAW